MSAKAKQSIDSDLLLLFAKDFEPFSIVEDVGFRRFVHSLNPSYTLPGKKTISKTLIPALYETCLNKAKAAAQGIVNLCITTDCWTSSNNESFIAITGHFIDDTFKMRSILLECDIFEGSHTGLNLSKTLIEVAKNWGLEKKVILAVSDNAANIKNAIAYTGWKHFGCFTHSLNLTVQGALKVVHAILEKIKIIVAYFKRSSKATKILIDIQKKNGVAVPLKLIQDVVTRWNSTYNMINRFVELEESLRSTLGLLDVQLPTISVEEWTILKELCQILAPFDEATKCVSGENYMSASLVIVLTKGLLEVCENLRSTETFSELSRQILNNLQEGIRSRLGDVEYSSTLAMSTFLDPRFKYFGFKNKDAVENVKKDVLNALTETITAENKEDPRHHESEPGSTPVFPNKEGYSLWDSLDKCLSKFKPYLTSNSMAVTELQRYLGDGVLSRNKNPLDWWRENQYNYPYLSRLVRSKCCALGTSVPCERIFSKAGNILNERRTRLNNKTLKHLLFINVNNSF
nr:unnamed protein product [Callosobruchus analis]